MKKLISISSTIAMVALLVGPVAALGNISPSPTPTPINISTGLTPDTSGGATPAGLLR